MGNYYKCLSLFFIQPVKQLIDIFTCLAVKIACGLICEDDFRIKSTSVSGIVRYLYFVVSSLVYNLWVYLNLLFCENVDDFRIILKKDVMRLIGSMLVMGRSCLGDL